MDNTVEQNLYSFLRDSYLGTGGFFNGAYLTQHPREDVNKYQYRQKTAYYLNYLQPCVNAHVAPIFKQNPNRSGENALWTKFIDSVDYVGTSLDDFMKQLATASKLLGSCFAVLDIAKTVTSTNLEQTIVRREYPYAFIVEPQRIKKLETDKFGMISLFAYTEPSAKDPKKNNIRVLTKTDWKLFEGDADITKDSPLEQGETTYNQVPVVALLSRDVPAGQYFPPSEFISIAQTNKYIYNLCSLINEIAVNQTFSVLSLPTNARDEIKIGTSEALKYPPDATNRPEFITPSVAGLETLINLIDHLQKECYRMATVVNITGVRSELSGVAKAWDFESTNQILAVFADNVESAEIAICNLFQKMTNQTFDYTCNYPSDFSISDVYTELNNAEIAKGLQFGDKFNIEICKRVINSYLPEKNSDIVDILIEDYKKELAIARLDEDHTRDINSNEGEE